MSARNLILSPTTSPKYYPAPSPVTERSRHNVSFVAVASRPRFSNFRAVSLNPGCTLASSKELGKIWMSRAYTRDSVFVCEGWAWASFFVKSSQMFGLTASSSLCLAGFIGRLTSNLKTTAAGRSEGNRGVEDPVQSLGQPPELAEKRPSLPMRNVQQREVNWLI